MEAIFQKIIDNNFSDIAGFTADATIPVSQSLINEVIETALQDDKTITYCRVSIHEQNRVSVRLKTSLFPWPLNLQLKLDKSVDFTSFSSPKLRAWLENNRLLASLGSIFQALPAWARLYGNQVVVDLGSFLRTPEQKKLFGLIRSVEIRTTEGEVVLDVKIEADR